MRIRVRPRGVLQAALAAATGGDGGGDGGHSSPLRGRGRAAASRGSVRVATPTQRPAVEVDADKGDAAAGGAPPRGRTPTLRGGSRGTPTTPASVRGATPTRRPSRDGGSQALDEEGGGDGASALSGGSGDAERRPSASSRRPSRK